MEYPLLTRLLDMTHTHDWTAIALHGSMFVRHPELIYKLDALLPVILKFVGDVLINAQEAFDLLFLLKLDVYRFILDNPSTQPLPPVDEVAKDKKPHKELIDALKTGIKRGKLLCVRTSYHQER